MSKLQPSEGTLAYYDRNAEAFVAATLEISLEEIYTPFFEQVPAGGHILDAGCGSGRDSRAFLEKGYRVTAFDGSPELARRAEKIVGQRVEVLRFEEVGYTDLFEGVWACASLLHVPAERFDDVLDRLVRATRLKGVLYISFKLGEGQEMREGRLFCHHTERSFRLVLDRHPRLTLLRIWETGNVRPGRSEESWLNVLLRKQGPDFARDS